MLGSINFRLNIAKNLKMDRKKTVHAGVTDEAKLFLANTSVQSGLFIYHNG